MKARKLTALAVMTTLMFTMATTGSYASTVGKDKAIDKKQKQMQVQGKIAKDSKGAEKLFWNTDKGVPSFINGKLSTKKLNNAQDAVAILEENKGLFEMDSAVNELTLVHQEKDQLNTSMYKFKQTYKGVPVFGNELILHADANGDATVLNGYFDPEVKVKGLSVKPKLSIDQALEAAKKSAGLAGVEKFDIAEGELNIFQAQDKSHHLVYLVTLSTLEGDAPAYLDVFVDAHDGSIVNTINKMHTAAAIGTGTGLSGATRTLNTEYTGTTYNMRDITKYMYTANGGKIETYTANNGTSLPGTLMTDADNVWMDGAAVDAHYFAGVVYDYYYNKHNRNSFDNAGATMKQTVHYNSNYNNAFWNGTQMVYGDGDGSTFIPLSGSLDVVGHEITHAVTERTADLVYSYQSGALNESWSDALGNLIENKTDNTWLVGEDIYTPGTAGDALRSMSSPSTYGDPEHMSQYINTSSDNGGVHSNSGIPNKAFYNFVTTSGVSRDDAGKVWYRALTTYMTSTSQFTDARNATIQAATDLFGAGSTQVNAVTAAWTNVGVVPATPDAYESNNTQATAYGPITSGTVYNGQIGSGSDVDWFKFTTSDAGTISLSLSNLPGDYDLYLYNSAGTQLAKSENGSTTAESISYSAGAANTTYSVKIVGYNGAYSTSTSYALKATYPNAAVTGQWIYENMAFDTPHPYANNYNNGTAHTYTKAGALKVAIHYSRFETESGYDYANIKDKNGTIVNKYSGTQSAFWVIVDGDKITSNFTTDSSVTKWGYSIDQVGYFVSTPLNGVSTTPSNNVTPIVGQ